jgi:hypothetical protein
MHTYGEVDFDWQGISDAGWFIGGWLRKWVKMPVTQIKEKYGTLRVYCMFGWSTIYSIWRPHYMWIPQWWPYKLDLWLCYTLHLIDPLNKVVVPIQKKAYRWRYKLALKKWPHLHDEILDCADWPEELRGL